MLRQNGYLMVLAAGSLVGASFAGCSSETTSAGTGGSTSTTSSSTTFTTSSTTSVPTTSSTQMKASGIGKSCAVDAECGDELRCSKDSDTSPIFGGGAPGGYCTMDCLEDSDCPFDSTCVPAPDDGPGECLLTCTIGPELEFLDDPLDSKKCHGREDARCTPVSGREVCLPVCGKDSQCPGRVCNARSGFCTDSQSEGSPNGTVCDDKAPNEDGCAGFCQTFNNMTPSICASPCSLGGNLQGDDCGGIDKGLCVYRPTGYGPGDFGRCAAGCTEHDQCGNPAWWCFGNNFIDFTGGNGFCFTTKDCKTKADCDADQDCVDTKYGKKCLEVDMNNDLRYPLGDAAPPGTGGAGGSGGSGSGGAGGGP